MSYVFRQLVREWHFMRRQHYILLLLLCSFLISGFSVFTGLNEVNHQKQTIERLKLHDETAREAVQSQYSDPGYLAYYSFHLTYSEPSNLAFTAFGERDIHPWKHRIRMLALEGQIYESDSQNAELAQAGKVDFVFVISVLAPLFIILLFHDLHASERINGRYSLLVSTAKSSIALWGARITVRFIAISVCLMLPFFIGAMLAAVTFCDVLLVLALCIAYMFFWVLLSVWLGKQENSAPRIASILIGCWLLLAFIIPVLGDLAINQYVHSPKGGDISLTQREAVNDAWDLPVKTTIDAFVVTHPQYKNYTKLKEGFDWAWYFAFQQVGDQVAENLSNSYSAATKKKYDLAKYVSVLSPTVLFQRSMTRIANTDAIAAFQYEQQIRKFHQELRMFYYPWLFINPNFDKAKLTLMPRFDPNKFDKSDANKSGVTDSSHHIHNF